MTSTSYLELATNGDAAGLKVGKLPRSIPLQDLRDLGHPASPMKAIRANCVDCSGGSIADPTYADAVLDRLVHNAHRIDLKRGKPAANP
jgi:hypothetical protein